MFFFFIIKILYSFNFCLIKPTWIQLTSFPFSNLTRSQVLFFSIVVISTPIAFWQTHLVNYSYEENKVNQVLSYVFFIQISTNSYKIRYYRFEHSWVPWMCVSCLFMRKSKNYPHLYQECVYSHILWKMLFWFSLESCFSYTSIYEH